MTPCCSLNRQTHLGGWSRLLFDPTLIKAIRCIARPPRLQRLREPS